MNITLAEMIPEQEVFVDSCKVRARLNIYFDAAGGSGLAVEGQPDHVKRILERAQQQQTGGAPAPETATGGTIVKVTLYKNGFIVDDGSFRSLDDPEHGEKNKKFVSDLAEGYAPREVVFFLWSEKPLIFFVFITAFF
jgi:hypothetical protein